MASKILVGAVVAVGAAVAMAAPVGADPSVFSEIHCSCSQTVSSDGSSVADQIDRGLEAGLSGTPAVQAPQ
ncbi:hypothetical protein A5660_22990 [Mycobacterium alsense]|uniref:hypothetical protein n=1 Tax=Mycobacterium alsense TaxID=324058 RepID=UPI0007FEDB0E|nr:hypothetical protein [Mycobacterium alsense]OBJ01796.1 hypothetical protein A5660_22990 [Mycobacterium alsense]